MMLFPAGQRGGVRMSTPSVSGNRKPAALLRVYAIGKAQVHARPVTIAMHGPDRLAGRRRATPHRTGLR